MGGTWIFHFVFFIVLLIFFLVFFFFAQEKRGRDRQVDTQEIGRDRCVVSGRERDFVINAIYSRRTVHNS